MHKNIRDALNDLIDIPKTVSRRYKLNGKVKMPRLQWIGISIMILGVLTCVWFHEIRHSGFGGAAVGWCAANLKRYGFSGAVFGIGLIVWLLGMRRYRKQNKNSITGEY